MWHNLASRLGIVAGDNRRNDNDRKDFNDRPKHEQRRVLRDKRHADRLGSATLRWRSGL